MRQAAPAIHAVNTPCFASFALACAITTAASAQMSDVIISQYVEGGLVSPNADAIELFNGTGADIDLAAGGYKLLRYDDGASTPSATINLSGTLPSRGKRVYVNAATTISALTAKADVLDGDIAFSGDDAIVLVKGAGNTVVDSFGQVGNNPGSQWGSGSSATNSNGLIRRPEIRSGRTTSTALFTPSTEWVGDSAGYANTLGVHTAFYAYGLPASVLSATGNPSSNGWTLYQDGCTGEFLGNSGSNGGSLNSGAGAGNPAWAVWTSNGLFCNSNSEIHATQMLGGGDTVINTVDFTFIGVNFFRPGEACGAFDGPIARDRISVRELRRTGMGELIQADLNGDGWVDLDDMQYYMQFAGQ